MSHPARPGIAHCPACFACRKIGQTLIPTGSTGPGLPGPRAAASESMGVTARADPPRAAPRRDHQRAPFSAFSAKELIAIRHYTLWSRVGARPPLGHRPDLLVAKGIQRGSGMYFPLPRPRERPEDRQNAQQHPSTRQREIEREREKAVLYPSYRDSLACWLPPTLCTMHPVGGSGS